MTQQPTTDSSPPDRRSRFSVFALLCAVLLSVGTTFFGDVPAARAQDNTSPKYPHVVWLKSPDHRATVVWMTVDKGEEHKLYFDTESHEGDLDEYRYHISAQRTVAEFKDKVWFHHAVIDGLHPSTEYHFVVETDGQASEERFFRTAPNDDRPFKLLYGGDSRSNPDSRREINKRIRALVTDDEQIIGLAHGGDFVAEAMVWEQWKQWLEDWQLTTTSEGRVVPIIPGRGNHEFSAGLITGKTDNYNAIFGFPGGDEEDYWTTELGSQVAFITLNSNSTLGGDQRDWLDAQLDKFTDTRKWVVANYHRPAYPAVKSPGAARQHWVPLFEKYNVDLVCESDGHVLKRTVPIREGEQAEDGIVYVGEGGLGVKQRTPDDRWYLQAPGMTMSVHHVQLLSFGPDELDYEAIKIDGSVADSATFDKRREQPADPIELDDAYATSQTRVEVDFSKGIAAESIMSSEADFTIVPDIEIGRIEPHKDFDDVIVLRTGELYPDVEYRLSVTGVKDHLGNRLDETLEATLNPQPNGRPADQPGKPRQAEVEQSNSSGSAHASSCSVALGDALPITLAVFFAGAIFIGIRRRAQ